MPAMKHLLLASIPVPVVVGSIPIPFKIPENFETRALSVESRSFRLIFGPFGSFLDERFRLLEISKLG